MRARRRSEHGSKCTATLLLHSHSIDSRVQGVMQSSSVRMMLRAPRPRLVSPQVTAVTWTTASPSPSRFASSFVPSHPRREQAPKQVPVNAPKGTPIGKVLDRRLKIVFTCTAPTPDDAAATCGHRSSHEFSRNSYEKGVVIVQCPQCNNRHLIGTVSSRTPLPFSSLPFD